MTHEPTKNAPGRKDSGTPTRAPPTKDTDWSDLSAFQRDTLVTICRLEERSEPPYGLAIKRALEAWYDAEVNNGRLYPNLDELVERGLIAKGTIDDRTNSYRLTDGARDLLADRAATLATLPGVHVTEGQAPPEVVPDGGPEGDQP